MLHAAFIKAACRMCMQGSSCDFDITLFGSQALCVCNCHVLAYNQASKQEIEIGFICSSTCMFVCGKLLQMQQL